MLLRACFTDSDTERADREDEQLEKRICEIVADLTTHLTIGAECMRNLIDTIIKPAYELHKTMNSSRIPYYFAWSQICYRRPPNAFVMSRIIPRDIHTSKGSRPGVASQVVHDLYPGLTEYESGSSEWEMLVAPVVVTDS